MNVDNLDKATRIVEGIIAIDYGGDLDKMQGEMGCKEGVIQDVYFWLEDGNGDGLPVEDCRLMFEL